MNLRCVGAIAIVSTLLCQTAFAEKNAMTFKNQRGSILELHILADNKIEGYFTTAVASKTCPNAINKKRPITGYLIGNAITFSVVYPMCESVLSVSGNLDNEKATIDTIAILNKQAGDITHEGPGARFIGHDSYQKIS